MIQVCLECCCFYVASVWSMGHVVCVEACEVLVIGNVVKVCG